MDGPAVTKRADVPVPNEINRDPPVSRTPLRLSEIQRLPDGQSSRRSQPAWATTDRDRSHGASSLDYRFACRVRASPRVFLIPRILLVIRARAYIQSNEIIIIVTKLIRISSTR